MRKRRNCALVPVRDAGINYTDVTMYKTCYRSAECGRYLESVLASVRITATWRRSARTRARVVCPTSTPLLSNVPVSPTTTLTVLPGLMRGCVSLTLMRSSCQNTARTPVTAVWGRSAQLRTTCLMLVLRTKRAVGVNRITSTTGTLSTTAKLLVTIAFKLAMFLSQIIILCTVDPLPFLLWLSTFLCEETLILSKS